MKKIINKFINRINVSQIFYKIRDLLKSSKNAKLVELKNNGFCVLDEILSSDIINRLKYKYVNYNDFNFVNFRKKIDLEDLKEVYKELNSSKALSIVEQYLGNNIYCYDNSVLTLGNLISNEGSWQPHHDSKGRRLKIYIWLDEENFETHPLYYLRSSNKNFFLWNNYNQTRFNKVDSNYMTKIYGDLGRIIIFDTHGIHSSYKTSTLPRSVIELTFEAFGYLNRVNDKFKNDSNEINRLGAKKLKHLL